MTRGYRLLADYLTQLFEIDDHLLRPDVPLTDVGVDSLALIELGMRIEDDHGISLTGLDPFSTLAEAADALDQALGTPAAETTASPGPAPAIQTGADR
ncbi:acyl carrier protein [Streptomyces sp. NPDC050803]|uniref:acyl carrier protein n=1 Tax=unclassified Streptomyces TaxID=2593676 RepID=UPI00343C5E38